MSHADRVAGTIVGGFLGHVIFMVVALYLDFNWRGHEMGGVSTSKAAHLT